MKKLVCVLFFIISMSILVFSLPDARLLRFPDINGDLVAFVYAGDIWTVPASGGNAVRLTSHEGLELFPKISPDGKWIAFSGEYPGTRQIFIMPATGGVPRQLTYYNDAEIKGLPPRGGFDHIPLDWTNDSQKILIRANRTPYAEREGKYFLVGLDGGLEQPLQIPDGGFGSFSPDETSIVYTPICREFRTWKRYTGGRAQDVWIYDLVKDTAEQITDFLGTDQHPSWYKDKIYFVSDREDTPADPAKPVKLNIWAYDRAKKTFARMTDHREFDVLWPSGHGGSLAYENGGYIYKLNLEKGMSEKLTVNINFDNPNTLPYFKNVGDFMSEFGNSISPTGKRVAFDARGDLFTVPAKEGITYNLTRTPGFREMYPTWSPDGQWIAYVSDQTGDYEFYLLDSQGKGAPTQLTFNHKTWKFPALWSPDSQKLLIYDKNRQLQVLNIKTKVLTIIDKAQYNDVDDVEWSDDSNWVVYTKAGSNWLEGIWVYSLTEGKSRLLLDNTYNNYSPSLSKDGQYLYFISDRDFNMNFESGFSNQEFDFVYNKTARIYALALTKDAPKLFDEKNDQEEVKAAAAEKPKKEKTGGKEADDKKPAQAKPLKIDFDGIAGRIMVFPLPTDQYGRVIALEDKVLYTKAGNIYLYDLKEKKSSPLLEGVGGWDLSADKKKILYSQGNKYGIVDVAPNQKPGDGLLNLDGLTMKIDPVKEWNQLYHEGWRLFRDWFYVGNMHGVDWQKMNERYAALLPYLGHRFDLDYIFGELVGELNTGHTYVNYGDFKKVPRLDTGLLGVEFKTDEKAGRYIIAKIYAGENWNESTRSPLTEQGIDVKEGDYLISLNGYDVTTQDNPYRFLENTAGKKIEITVNAVPAKTGARTYLVKPIKQEFDLRTLDWVNTRRQMVDKLSGGRIGYIFVPNTAVEGNRELFKGVYSYSDKDAFIIDDRYNQGGWSPVKMIEKLAQNPVSYWHHRGLELEPEPLFTLDGPKVMLINYYSSSGGDNFPYWFKKLNLGKLIGTRTWGGLVGYGWLPSLLDGGSFAVPMSGIVSTEGQFAVEGVGIFPDEGFEVYDRPDLVAKGQDPSIEVAVKYLLEELKKNPTKKVPNPPDPDRSRWYKEEKK